MPRSVQGILSILAQRQGQVEDLEEQRRLREWKESQPWPDFGRKVLGMGLGGLMQLGTDRLGEAWLPSKKAALAASEASTAKTTAEIAAQKIMDDKRRLEIAGLKDEAEIKRVMGGGGTPAHIDPTEQQKQQLAIEMQKQMAAPIITEKTGMVPQQTGIYSRFGEKSSPAEIATSYNLGSGVMHLPAKEETYQKTTPGKTLTRDEVMSLPSYQQKVKALRQLTPESRYHLGEAKRRLGKESFDKLLKTGKLAGYLGQVSPKLRKQLTTATEDDVEERGLKAFFSFAPSSSMRGFGGRLKKLSATEKIFEKHYKFAFVRKRGEISKYLKAYDNSGGTDMTAYNKAVEIVTNPDNMLAANKDGQAVHSSMYKAFIDNKRKTDSDTKKFNVQGRRVDELVAKRQTTEVDLREARKIKRTLLALRARQIKINGINSQLRIAQAQAAQYGQYKGVMSGGRKYNFDQSMIEKQNRALSELVTDIDVQIGKLDTSILANEPQTEIRTKTQPDKSTKDAVSRGDAGPPKKPPLRDNRSGLVINLYNKFFKGKPAGWNEMSKEEKAAWSAPFYSDMKSRGISRDTVLQILQSAR